MRRQSMRRTAHSRQLDHADCACAVAVMVPVSKTNRAVLDFSTRVFVEAVAVADLLHYIDESYVGSEKDCLATRRRASFLAHMFHTARDTSLKQLAGRIG